MTAARGRAARGPWRRPVVDGMLQHRDWLGLVEVSGPFLSIPVLRETWPAPDAIEPGQRDRLRRAHDEWRADPDSGQRAWVEYVLGELLEWRDELRFDGVESLAVEVDPGCSTQTNIARRPSVGSPTGTAPRATPLSAGCRDAEVELN